VQDVLVDGPIRSGLNRSFAPPNRPRAEADRSPDLLVSCSSHEH